ncbi:MAG: 2-oxo acid dehydrogenase subunit E2, partial [Fimbriimonadaceae bacterium]|nr:2-oxo acid dehydrogenase subunit E2 [Fimbriimonadaceae bacterium]
MTEVIMPKMGDGMEEGTLLEWLKKDGDAVKSGDVIGTIQTDKATLELESPGSGTPTGFLIGEGETVPVGRPIAAILKKGESLPETWGGAVSAPAAAEEAAPVAAAAGSAPAVEAAPADQGRVKASPLARKIAEDAGLNLAGVAGSGPGGRIVEKDVRAALAAGTTIASVAAAPAPAAPAPTSQPKAPAPAPTFTPGEDVKVPLNRLRTVIAQRTQQSKQEVPHFYVTLEVDLEGITALRGMFKKESSGNVSVNDFVVKAVALALRDTPAINATFQGDHILRFGSVHVGIAAAVDDGLLVPVIKHADQLTLRQIAVESKNLVAKAREGKLNLDEMTGSTFSISNMGMLNVDAFGAIINQPNAG